MSRYLAIYEGGHRKLKIKPLLTILQFNQYRMKIGEVVQKSDPLGK